MDDQTYQIAISPDLDISLEEFASNLLSDLIKGIIQKLNDKKSAQSNQDTTTHKQTSIEQVKLPNGYEMLVVKIDAS